MKYEWKKKEKEIYLPKGKPGYIQIPSFKYYSIRGQGNPNDKSFAEYIGVLYSLSYAIKMSPKSGNSPSGYYEYTVYPLEGIWELTEKGKQKHEEKLDKNELLFDLMIRQPSFVDKDYAYKIIEYIKKKKPHELLEKVEFITVEEGDCVQMLHIGSYDSEVNSFKIMENYCKENKLERISRTHREIYLSDARKVQAEKLKTVLRFKVKKQIN